MTKYVITVNDGDPLYVRHIDNGLEIEAREVRDEYHTMHELYQHRMALNIALFRMFVLGYNEELVPFKVWKSKLHHDGTMFDGYFIVMADTPKGQISYHYKLKHWDDFTGIPEVEQIPVPYDGHTSNDVIERLMKL